MKLKNNDIIFRALVGSHAYGTNVEGSDMDYKGIYIQSPEDVLEHGYQEQITINKDEVYFEIRRFIELCCSGNPTMLELLFIPENCIIYKDDIFDLILEHKNIFLSKSCRYSFGGYAYSQISKANGLDKKMNWEKERVAKKDILDFCYVVDNHSFNSYPIKGWLDNQQIKQEEIGLSKIEHFKGAYNMFLACNEIKYRGIVKNIETSNDINVSDIPKNQKRIGILYFNLDEHGRYCKDYKSYQEWLKNRNVQRYVDSSEHGQMIDGKNLLHCVRLLETAIEIAKYHTLNVLRLNAEYLISIRKGKLNLEEILKQCNEKMIILDVEFLNSTLPDKVDRSFAMKLITKIRKEFYTKQK